MDTKDVEPERSQYQRLKAKYAKPINKPKKGIYCKVEFFADPPAVRNCSFLYYFRYTSRPYDTQEPLLKDLNQCVEYRKTISFFNKSKGLHSYFVTQRGKPKKLLLMPLVLWMKKYKRKVGIILSRSWWQVDEKTGSTLRINTNVVIHDEEQQR